ncbi:MAG: type II secretion system GspH family protein [Heliobacteriaceae bacterium]|jgi:prepilin-type N-terminal cleavage/methylation domain-containing protein|nr:type II secretion system GspH family protein [Heliobacteriaceae bacterium]
MKNAFTLAEVLITLGIIGVVAALTMPALIANYEKRVTVTKVKKTVNLIYNAVQKAYVDNDNNYFDSTSGSAVDFYNWVVPHLKIIKACKNPAVDGKCGLDVVTCAHGRDTGCSTAHAPITAPRVILADGTIVSFRKDGLGIEIMFDIDGPKGKNRMGYDIWSGLSYNSNRAQVLGAPDGTSNGGNCKTGNGGYCLGQLQVNNWEINWR